MANPSRQYPTRAERRRAGRAARANASRLGQAEWNPGSRKGSLVELIFASERGRVPQLLPIKQARMAASPFAFYRGAVPVMAADLARSPHTDLVAQLCGDAHVHNLGSYTAPDGRMVFALNDFDETIPGPFERDVKRMGASLVLAGRGAGDSDAQCKDAMLEFMRRYREAMHAFAQMPAVELARYQVSRFLKGSPVATVLHKALRATNRDSFEKLTIFRDGRHSLRAQKPVQSRVPPEEARKVYEAIRDYGRALLPERRHFLAQYHVEDVAFRVVGWGSAGLRDYVVLLLGGGVDDPLFLQMKEATRSAYAPYLPAARGPEHQGARVAAGQRAMQVQSDIFLGWTSMGGRDYLMRQLRDHTASIADGEVQGRGLAQYARVCGTLLAKGHARSGDPCTLDGYMGNSPKFDQAIAKFAVAYADQTSADFALITRALRGRPRAAGPAGSRKNPASPRGPARQGPPRRGRSQ